MNSLQNIIKANDEEIVRLYTLAVKSGDHALVDSIRKAHESNPRFASAFDTVDGQQTATL